MGVNSYRTMRLLGTFHLKCSLTCNRKVGGAVVPVVDEEHLLDPGAHPRHHLQLPGLVEEVRLRGNKFSEKRQQ